MCCNHLGGPLSRLNPCGHQLSSVAELLTVHTAFQQLEYVTRFRGGKATIYVFSKCAHVCAPNESENVSPTCFRSLITSWGYVLRLVLMRPGGLAVKSRVYQTEHRV